MEDLSASGGKVLNGAEALTALKAASSNMGSPLDRNSRTPETPPLLEMVNTTTALSESSFEGGLKLRLIRCVTPEI